MIYFLPQDPKRLTPRFPKDLSDSPIFVFQNGIQQRKNVRNRKYEEKSIIIRNIDRCTV
jgi:hypothetical protein